MWKIQLIKRHLKEYEKERKKNSNAWHLKTNDFNKN